MQNLIDKTYFWGEIEITGMFKPEVEDELNKFIAKYQKKYLTGMFGGIFNTDIPADIIAMLRDEETLTSPIANYVYYFWQRKNASVQTNAGTKGLNTQNTTSVSPSMKMERAWNEMVEQNEEIHTYMSKADTDEYDYLNGIYPNIDFDLFKDINTFGI